MGLSNHKSYVSCIRNICRPTIALSRIVDYDRKAVEFRYNDKTDARENSANHGRRIHILAYPTYP